MNEVEKQAAAELQALLNEKFPDIRVVPGNSKHSREPGIPLEIRGLLKEEIPEYQNFLCGCLAQKRVKGPAILMVIDDQERLLNIGMAG